MLLLGGGCIHSAGISLWEMQNFKLQPFRKHPFWAEMLHRKDYQVGIPPRHEVVTSQSIRSTLTQQKVQTKNVVRILVLKILEGHAAVECYYVQEYRVYYMKMYSCNKEAVAGMTC